MKPYKHLEGKCQNLILIIMIIFLHFSGCVWIKHSFFLAFRCSAGLTLGISVCLPNRLAWLERNEITLKSNDTKLCNKKKTSLAQRHFWELKTFSYIQFFHQMCLDTLSVIFSNFVIYSQMFRKDLSNILYFFQRTVTDGEQYTSTEGNCQNRFFLLVSKTVIMNSVTK